MVKFWSYMVYIYHICPNFGGFGKFLIKLGLGFWIVGLGFWGFGVWGFGVLDQTVSKIISHRKLSKYRFLGSYRFGHFWDLGDWVLGIGVLGFLGFGDWVLASLLKSVNFGQFLVILDTPKKSILDPKSIAKKWHFIKKVPNEGFGVLSILAFLVKKIGDQIYCRYVNR